MMEPFHGPVYERLLAAEADLVSRVLSVHSEPEVRTVSDGHMYMMCKCSGWGTEYSNPEEATVQHYKHVAERVVRRLRGWPL